MKNQKTLVITRSVSGAGKSTFANLLCKNIGYISCSADNYFLDENGNYNFDATKIHLAHLDCQKKCVEALNEPTVEVIIVDNTNVDDKAIKVYQDLAEKHGATFISLVVEKRHDGPGSIHNVPSYTLDKQEARIRESLKLR